MWTISSESCDVSRFDQHLVRLARRSRTGIRSQMTKLDWFDGWTRAGQCFECLGREVQQLGQRRQTVPPLAPAHADAVPLLQPIQIIEVSARIIFEIAEGQFLATADDGLRLCAVERS